jgi:ankyrin repeat protein
MNRMKKNTKTFAVMSFLLIGSKLTAYDVNEILSPLDTVIYVDRSEAFNSPLHDAASFSCDEVRLLLEMGADINSQNALGETPLHLAAFFNQRDIVDLLLEMGARTDICDNNGGSAQESIHRMHGRIIHKM